MKNKETVFRVGDKVYDANHGWGDIVEHVDVDEYPDDYPVFVEFASAEDYYTIDGRPYCHKPPSLSFTEYDYINGGFSQERPKEGFLKFDGLDFIAYGNNIVIASPKTKDSVVLKVNNVNHILDRKNLETLNNYLNTILEK